MMNSSIKKGALAILIAVLALLISAGAVKGKTYIYLADKPNSGDLIITTSGNTLRAGGASPLIPFEISSKKKSTYYRAFSSVSKAKAYIRKVPKNVSVTIKYKDGKKWKVHTPTHSFGKLKTIEMKNFYTAYRRYDKKYAISRGTKYAITVKYGSRKETKTITSALNGKKKKIRFLLWG